MGAGIVLGTANVLTLKSCWTKKYLVSFQTSAICG
jgi:hypothetical protein